MRGVGVNGEERMFKNVSLIFNVKAELSVVTLAVRVTLNGFCGY